MSKKNVTNMNANQARLKYFNSYVEFEFLIRRLAGEFGIKSKIGKQGVKIRWYSNTTQS